jgi:ketosteroid isomerase-like protein
MSEENVEIVRAQYASFQALGEGGDVRSHFLRFFASDAEYWPVEEIDAICGHDALIRYTERWLDAWESYRDQVDEIIDGSELVVGAVTVHGRGRGSGVQIAQTMFHVFEIRDAKIAQLREYLDRGRALEAAGLSE